MNIDLCIKYIMLDSVVYRLMEEPISDSLLYTKVKCIKLFRKQLGIEDGVGETYKILNLVLFTLGKKVPNIKGALYE